MAVVRTNGNLPLAAGLPGRALRTALWVYNGSAANTLSVGFASGFTIPLQPGATLQRTIAGGGDVEGLQGAITITGTVGQPYDIEETYR